MAAPEALRASRNSLAAVAVGSVAAGIAQFVVIKDSTKGEHTPGIGRNGVAHMAMAMFMVGIVGAVILAFTAPENPAPNSVGWVNVLLAAIAGGIAVNAVAYLVNKSYTTEQKYGISMLTTGAVVGSAALALSV